MCFCNPKKIRCNKTIATTKGFWRQIFYFLLLSKNGHLHKNLDLLGNSECNNRTQLSKKTIIENGHLYSKIGQETKAYHSTNPMYDWELFTANKVKFEWFLSLILKFHRGHLDQSNRRNFKTVTVFKIIFI